jgi:hypothetical protein
MPCAARINLLPKIVPADNGDTAIATSVIRKSAAAASAARTRAVTAKFRDSGARHFPWPLPSPLPLLSPPLQKSLVCRLVVASMPPPLVLSNLPLLLKTPIEAPSPLVLWRLSSRLPLVCRLVVASSVIMRLRLASPFVEQPHHVSILDPPSLFVPAGCSVSCCCRRHRLRPSSSAAAPCCLPIVSLSCAATSPRRPHRCRCHAVAVVVAAVVVVNNRCARRAATIAVVADARRCRRRPRRHRQPSPSSVIVRLRLAPPFVGQAVVAPSPLS